MMMRFVDDEEVCSQDVQEAQQGGGGGAPLFAIENALGRVRLRGKAHVRRLFFY